MIPKKENLFNTVKKEEVKPKGKRRTPQTKIVVIEHFSETGKTISELMTEVILEKAKHL